ncbi:MAG: S46 family peptidase, partial [Planctomycetes bacterium]|nr:S46 family peptidase [Planctomycetota bacterium]
NPGSTGRLNTCGQMNYLRDARYPILLQRFDDELPIVKAQAAVDAAYDKRTKAQVLRMENSQKAVRGYLNSLLDASLTEAKGRAEALFKGKIAADPKLWAEYGSAWAELEKINHEKTSLEPKRSFYAASPYSQEMRRAAALVAATDEARSEKQRAAAAKQVKIQLTASPVRQKLFAASLRRAKQWLGDDDPVIQLLIGNRTIEEAIEQIQKSVVADAGEVDKLLDGGRKALESSGDAVIRAALLVDQQAKIVGARMAELNTRESVQATRIGRALYAAYGNSVSPDATFSLRFSDGLVKGFPCNGTLAPYRTTFYGLYARNVEFDNVHPFDLPEIWLARKNKIDMRKGVCFVATNDIIGGNSGSPIVNTDLEVIGLIFDGNIEMLGNRFLYRDDVPRSVSVHSDAILEACSKIYEAQRIVDEIRTGSK